MMPAPEPISPWAKVTRYSRSNYERDPVMVRSPPFIPFDSASSSVDNRISPSSIERCSNWGIPSSKEKRCNSDTSLRSSSRPGKKSLTHTQKFDKRSKLNCWPVAPSPLLGKLWMPPSNASNKREPIAPSTRFYFAKPFGMSATTKHWSIRETTSTVNCRLEDDHLRRPRPARVLRLLPSSTFWHSSTTHLCATCMKSHSSRTEATTTDTMSEVAVFTP